MEVPEPVKYHVWQVLNDPEKEFNAALNGQEVSTKILVYQDIKRTTQQDAETVAIETNSLIKAILENDGELRVDYYRDYNGDLIGIRVSKQKQEIPIPKAGGV